MSDKLQYFNKEDLNDILNGSVFLACGGGGARENGNILLDNILQYTDEVAYINPSDVHKDSYMPVLAGMGAPEAFKKIGFKNAPKSSFELQQSIIRKNLLDQGHKENFEFKYTVPVESGAIPFFMSMLVAVQKEIAIVNGDGGGRAFPKLEMSTFAAEKIPVSPAVLVSEESVENGGTSMMFNHNDPKNIDNLTRVVINTENFNNVAALSSFSMSGEMMQKVIVPNTISRAKDLGKILREHNSDSLWRVLDYLDGYHLFKGHVEDISMQTKNGFDFGKITVKDPSTKKIATVLTHNENLIVLSDTNKPLAIAPDSICYMNDLGETFSNADIKVGDFIHIVGFAAAKQIRTPYFITIFEEALNALGYQDSYVTIEKLQE